MQIIRLNLTLLLINTYYHLIILLDTNVSHISSYNNCLIHNSDWFSSLKISELRYQPVRCPLLCLSLVLNVCVCFNLELWGIAKPPGAGALNTNTLQLFHIYNMYIQWNLSKPNPDKTESCINEILNEAHKIST